MNCQSFIKGNTVMAECIHTNATITFYEEKATDYKLQMGIIAEINDDIEAQPLRKVDVRCPDCSLNVTYPDWHLAPSQLFTYCQRIYQQEYGRGPKITE
jgi:hypothetical protein